MAGRLIIPALLAALFLPSGGAAIETPNRALGERLFSSTALSTNGRSCAGCHANGKGLQEIAAYDDPMLREMINFCIRDALKGEMLPADSQELESLLLYLRTLDRSTPTNR
ncbi:di-heme cytochrome c peroxidase [Geothermobacter ehrlichii]|uniref:Di-heme cytochrome c peroxidase n=1 Tax=Geothermobacter ehrlichii TaxID=213224 RepID=A0A5D3WL23_9BACT|nr:cytochrome C [Geothermobacter ehrlichii]TYO99727.1 di-heme cytochrome c peroxidase [Geothermobacter ehrlichii]